jgi:hypothetical protein
MRYPSMNPSSSIPNIFLHEHTFLFFMISIQEFCVTPWSVFEDQFTFSLLNLFSSTIVHDREVDRTPLSRCPHSAEYLPKFFRPSPTVYVSQVFTLSSAEIIRSTYVY